MKLNALLVDMEVLGDEAWGYLERVCAMLPDLGVIVCTGRSTVAQRVRGLRLGVDDWIAKPCHPEEVMARVEAVSRRRRRSRAARRGRPGRGRRAGDPRRPVPGLRRRRQPRPDPARVRAAATARRRQGQVLEREVIYQRVWGYAMAHGDRSVDVFIRKLRQKLEKRSPSWRYIHTHFGVGYRFDPETAGGVAPELAGRGADAAASSAQPADSQVVHSSFTPA